MRHRQDRPHQTVKLRFSLFLLLACVAGCATPPPPACTPAPVAQGDVVYVVGHGWHTDLAIPADVLRGDMTVFRKIFPGLKLLVVGFGKRTFMMSPVTDLGDLIVGPFPGDGTLLVVGLNASPEVAYSEGTEALVHLPPGGAERLSDFLWHTFRVKDGLPVKIGDGFFPGSIFYATRTGYAGWFTCNTWAADALHVAGVDISAEGVLFSGQVLSRAEPVSGGLCAITPKR